jgi:hypothetical protein
MLAIAKWASLTACGLLALAIVFAVVITVGGILSPFPDTEITREKPYANFVGREYRVTSDVSAYAWNDFPDKAKDSPGWLVRRRPGAGRLWRRVHGRSMARSG